MVGERAACEAAARRHHINQPGMKKLKSWEESKTPPPQLNHLNPPIKQKPMNKKNDDDLPIFVVWMEFLEWLMPTTAKFPRKIRHTFAERIEALALDVCEDLTEARYASKTDKLALLKRINLKLEKLRVLLRLSHKLQYLSHNAYEHAARSINDAGQQLGHWIKQQEE